MKQIYETFAAYNGWANSRLYDAVAQVPDADYRRDEGAFFGSLHGTLNHILVGDRIWMRRFTGKGPAHNALDEAPCDQFEHLQNERRKEDDRITDWISGLSDGDLDSTFAYKNMAGVEHSKPLWQCASHFFNHQTHHRGQAHALLTRITRDAPPLDMIYFYDDQVAVKN